jgi:hypothetical protein
MLETELIHFRGIVPPFRAIPQGSSHRPAEQLKLLVPHDYILSHPAQHPLITDHAILDKLSEPNNQMRGQPQKQFPAGEVQATLMPQLTLVPRRLDRVIPRSLIIEIGTTRWVDIAASSGRQNENPIRRRRPELLSRHPLRNAQIGYPAFAGSTFVA